MSETLLYCSRMGPFSSEVCISITWRDLNCVSNSMLWFSFTGSLVLDSASSPDCLVMFSMVLFYCCHATKNCLPLWFMCRGVSIHGRIRVVAIRLLLLRAFFFAYVCLTYYPSFDKQFSLNERSGQEKLKFWDSLSVPTADSIIRYVAVDGAHTYASERRKPL